MAPRGTKNPAPLVRLGVGDDTALDYRLEPTPLLGWREPLRIETP